ncbi:Hypothetical protein CINCED_3A024130 [Cinara cedri]|nr:Hypothetical protein CINCED_3A024130 [Cinara cedri]
MNIDQTLISAGMGRYQFISCLLFGIMILYTNITSVLYIFTAGDLKYRCEIPECDSLDRAKWIYEPDWLRFTTPYRSDTGKPQKCQRFARNHSSGTNTNLCERSEFDETATESCRDRWVFEDYENTIGTEFGLMCEENKWKLSLVGSVHNMGQFIGIPVSGIVSDKFGRKFTMVVGSVLTAMIYIVQSFSVSYPMFLVLEVLSSSIFSGVYGATFILAMELVLPDKRVLYYSILECFNPIGGMIVALIASQVKDWRILLRMSNVLGLFFISYHWLAEESMRWMEMQGKHDKVISVLKKIATVNKKTLLDLPSDTQMESKNNEDENDAKVNTSILKDIFRSSTIFWRMIRCSLLWIAAAFVYYGLNISATEIAGNKYLNFALVSFVEIPACLFNWIIMERMSRKTSLFSMFLLSGATCIVYNISYDYVGFTLRLSLFMISKLAISIAFTIVYILTAEIFPTTMRATMLSLCSMFGRIGSMLSPQITLMAEYFGGYIAMFFMGSIAILAAVITVTLPESKNVKLPDTIDEAEKIGNDPSSETVEVSMIN